jgi:hypothetical protein
MATTAAFLGAAVLGFGGTAFAQGGALPSLPFLPASLTHADRHVDVVPTSTSMTVGAERSGGHEDGISTTTTSAPATTQTTSPGVSDDPAGHDAARGSTSEQEIEHGSSSGRTHHSAGGTDDKAKAGEDRGSSGSGHKGSSSGGSGSSSGGSSGSDRGSSPPTSEAKKSDPSGSTKGDDDRSGSGRGAGNSGGHGGDD